MDNATAPEPHDRRADADAGRARRRQRGGTLDVRTTAARRRRAADRREEVVHRPHLLGSREQGEADAARARSQREPHRVLRRRARPDRERDGDREGPAPHDDPQVLPGLHVRADGPRRPHVPPRQEHPEDHGLPRRHQADAGARARDHGRPDQHRPRARPESPRPASCSRPATRSASSTVRSRTSRPRSRKSRRTSRRSRSRCRCSVARRRSSLTSPRSRKHKRAPVAR